MSNPSSQTRQRVHELRLMAVQARYHALRMSSNAAAPDMRGYADELDDEAARLEDILGSRGVAPGSQRAKPRAS